MAVKIFARTALSVSIATCSLALHAGDRTWMGQEFCGTDWSVDCWANADMSDFSQPVAGDDVYYINTPYNPNGSTYLYYNVSGPAPVFNSLTIDDNVQNNPSGLWQLLQQGNMASGNETVGINSNALHMQFTGNNTVSNTLTLGVQQGSRGQYQVHSGTLSAANLVVGDSGTGQFELGSSLLPDAVPVVAISETLTVGKQAGPYDYFNGYSSFTQSKGTLSSKNEIVGDQGTGSVGHFGGSNTVAETLTLGRAAGSSGSYTLSTGGVGNGAQLSAKNEVVGDAGTGSFTQVGNSTNTVAETLTVARAAGGRGDYYMYYDAGELTAAAEIVGDAGYANFWHYGGNNSTGALTLGKSVGGQGTYYLSGGSLNTGSTTVGDGGYGSLNNQNAVHNVTQTLTLGKSVTGNGSYYVYGGKLGAHDVVVGDAGYGYFSQQGIVEIANTLTLARQAGSSGYYRAYTGSLSVQDLVIGDAGYGGFHHGGEDFPGFIVPYDGGTVTVANAIVLGKQSSGYGYYQLLQGMLNAKDVVVGDQGGAWFGQGSYYGNPTAPQVANISGTLTVGRQQGGSGEYHLYAGVLNARNEVIGDAGAGSFTQGENRYGYSSSNNVGATLTVGKQAGSHGVYNLIAGLLSAKDEVIGDAGTGEFNQSGGNHFVAQTQTLGKQAGGNGTYNLRAGFLAVGDEVVGDAGTGTFTQGEGNYGYTATNQVTNTLTLGKQAGGHGVYNLIAGLLSSKDTVVGDGGVGEFNQSGGSHIVAQALTLGKQAGGEGTYNLSSGLLLAANEIVGDAGTGTFTQGAGSYGYSSSNGVNGTLILGNQSGSHGIYNLLAGVLVTKGTVVGNAGTGTFNQLGGQHTVVGMLTLGQQDEGVGAYNLSAGQLTTTHTVVGAAGLGVFTQSGGTHTTQALVIGGEAGGDGAYNLLNGTLNAVETVVGDAGVGVFNQNGGTHNVGTLTLGRQAGSSGTYNLRGGNLNVSGDIANGAGTGSMLISGGALNFGAGNHDVDVDVFRLSGQGVVNLTDGAVATFEKAVVHNGKAINVDAGTRAIFNAAFSGKGPFTGKGTAQFNSVLNVGDGPITFNVEGDMVLGEHSKSVLEIGGTTRGSGYDAIDVGGALDLHGELDLLTLNGFSAHAGDVFDLISAEHITGQFDLLSLLALGDGLSWKIEYLVDAIGTKDIVRLSVVSSVPLPASLWLLQSALFGLFAARRYGRKGR